MSYLALATRTCTPFLFRPRAERIVTVLLAAAAAALWLVVLPVELALGLG